MLAVWLGASALAGAGCSSSEEEMLAATKAFLNAGHDVDDFEWPGTRLHVAARKGYMSVARLLVRHEANVNALGYIGWFTSGKMVSFGGLTPLHEAADSGHLDMVQLLLANGADVNIGSISPLHAAVRSGHGEIARLLLRRGADAGAKTEPRGETPLHWAVGAGRRRLLRVLLAAGADVNARDGAGFSPLHWSAYLGDREMAGILLARGADVNAGDNRGRTPLYWAAGPHRRAVADLLARRGGQLRLHQVLPPPRPARLIPID